MLHEAVPNKSMKKEMPTIDGIINEPTVNYKMPTIDGIINEPTVKTDFTGGLVK